MLSWAPKKTGGDVLRLSRIAVSACIVLLWIGVIAVALALPILFFGRADLLTHLGRDGIDLDAISLYALVAIGLVGTALLALFGILFLARLLAFIRSVGEGDPFAPANAQRFRSMAWLMLVMEIMGFGLRLYGQWLGNFSKDTDFGFAFSMSGLIAVLLLFVLARVFEHGTAMREDLEGTV